MRHRQPKRPSARRGLNKRSVARPTSASVTTKRCACGYLERQSEEPNIPIVFDKDVHEYHIKHPGGGVSVILHCPWCGGVAPESKRHTLFARLTMAETRRLQRLTARIKGVGDAIEMLGDPEHDRPGGMGVLTPGTEIQPPASAQYRTLTYTRLSKTADVILVDYGPEAGIRFLFQGKYIGKGGT